MGCVYVVSEITVRGVGGCDERAASGKHHHFWFLHLGLESCGLSFLLFLILFLFCTGAESVCDC